MTGDLELFLRGLFVNRWRCRHRHTRQLPSIVEEVWRFECLDCRCTAEISERDIMAARGKLLISGLNFVR